MRKFISERQEFKFTQQIRKLKWQGYMDNLFEVFKIGCYTVIKVEQFSLNKGISKLKKQKFT